MQLTQGIGLILVGEREAILQAHNLGYIPSPTLQLYFPWASQCNTASTTLLKALNTKPKSM